MFSFAIKSALRHHSNTDTEAGLGEVPAPRPLSSWPRPTVNILLPSPLGSSRCSVNSFFFFLSGVFRPTGESNPQESFKNRD